MRANSTISILSAAGSEKIAVPITAASRRRWKLMEEDSITLYFNLAESIDFAVGDYIVDEVFGRFVISEEPVPADYDPVSGAYKYTLRFDADWICWKNYILTLTYNGVRKETSWVLTDTLENHLAVVIQNLTAVGFTGYSVSVDANSVPDKGKAVCVTYSGTSILDALKNLADAYECEFWLDGKVIRFGKCLTGTMTDLSMTNENGRTINVENMVPMRNDSEYGNRFFAYGSTKNLPETYRKHLSFKADTTSRIGGYTAFKDSLRPMFPDFLKRSIVQTSNPTQHSYEDDWLDYSYTEEEDHDEMTTWKNIRVEKTTNPIPVVQGWPFTITPYTSQYGSFEYTVYIYDQDGNLLISTTNTLVPMTYTIPEGVDKITVRYSFESETHLSRPAPLPPTVEWLDNTEYAYFATVSYTGGTFLVRLMDGWFRAVNSRTGTVTYKNPPSGFIVNTEYTLLATGDDAIKVASIPYSYYTDDDDTTDSVRVLGERRLMLPRPPYSDSDLVAIQSHIENGYVQRESLSRDQIVERVVFFDEIYPRCALRITQVDVGEYANDTTYSDGSVKIANLPSYTLQAQLVTRSGDVAFPFDPETMMVVGKLTATFLTPDEAKVYSGRTTENACSLMGMTFDVACNRSNGVTTYQLVWNSDYGEKLPNEILMPKAGDCFILAGWNPAAMASLGLIDAAEKELALTADRYAELLEEAQFNFDCTMMSDWVKAWYDGKTPVSGELPFRRLILPGQSVRVFHGALSAPKETRVIGFEYKLDIPYDSPVLTVGESDAYSRLREIEKSLHASSQSSTATSNTTSVNIAGGGGSAQGGQTLHLTPGTMTGMSPVDYNGSEEKTFRVPSVIDHLVDSDKVPRIATNIAGDKVLVDKDGNEVSGKQFFEEVVDPLDSTKKYVRLKEEYTGFASPGWSAAGGVGSGGSGGGGGIIETVRGVADLNTPIVSESLTETFSAKAIQTIWDAVKVLQNTTPNVSLVNGANNSTLTVNGTTADFYTKLQIDAIVGAVYRPAGNASSVSELGTLTATNIGKVYNMTAAFTTTADFLEGVGKSFPAGTNVVIVDAGSGTYKYDVLSGFVDLSGYAQKVSGATNGNFAGLDANGDLADSGHNAEDFFAASGEVIIGTQSAATGSWTGASRLATATDLKSGYRFTYWLPYAGSGNATLTLTFKDGTTKAINLYYKGASRLTTHIGAGNKIDFLYLENANVAGTAYTGAWIDPGYQDGNYYDRLMSAYERRFIYSAQTPLYRYKICGYNNGKLVPLTITNQESATIVDKAPVTVGIEPKMGLVSYQTSTAITSASSVIGAVLYNEIPTTTPPYTFNDAIPAYKDVYLKGTIKGDGLFYLDTTTHKSWYVFAPNRPSDGEYLSVFVAGCYYMFVGPTYSSANYLQLKYNNPVFFFDGSRLVPIEELSDVVISDDEFYVRIAPTVNGKTTYTAKELRGRSIVWNQMVLDSFTAQTNNGINFSADSTNKCVSLSGTGTASYAGLTTMVGPLFVSGRKYFYHHKVIANPNNITDVAFGLLNQVGAAVSTNSEHQSIFTAYSTGKSLGINSGANGVDFTGFKIRFTVIDLTLMFGAGNEPATVEEFEAMFPLPYYDYNEGEIISNKTEEVKVTGFNQWDEEWENGYFYETNGEYKETKGNSQSCILSKNFVPVIPSTSYCYSVGKSGAMAYRVAFFDANQGYISMTHTSVSNPKLFTTPENCYYIKFHTETYSPFYLGDICINLSDPLKNGTYEPYKESTMNVGIPQMTANNVAIFPDGMKSARAAYDYAVVDEDGYIRKVVKRIGVADLGDLTWSLSGGYFYTGSLDEVIKLTNSTSEIANALCQKYRITTWTGSIDKAVYIAAASVSGKKVCIKDTAFAAAADFKTAMSGVLLYYELATPEEYTLDTPIYVGKNGTNDYYEGGVQSVVPEHTSTPTSAPFRAVLQYGISVEEVNRKLDLYLPLAGGTITGDLAVNGTFSVGGASSFASAITLSGSTNTARRIYFGDANHYLELDQYGFHFSHGVYSDDFVSAGGIGNGSGSGSATELGDLVDVSLTSRSNGDLLVYNSATSHWENKPQSSIIPSVSVSFDDLTSHPTTIAGYGITDGFKKTGGDISGDIYHEIEEEDVETGEISIYELWRITENGDASFGSLSVNGVDFSTINTRVNTLWNARNNYLPLSGGTMTGNIIMNGGSVLSATDSANQVGSVTNRFGNGFFRNLYATYFGFRDGSDGSIQRGTIGMGDGYTNIYMQASDGTPYGQYSFNATYGFFHDGNGNVPCGRSDHRWSELWAVDAGLSGDLVLSTNAKGIYGTDTSGNARRLITLANDNGIYFGNGNASRLNFSSNGLIQFSWGTSGSGRYVSFGDVAGSAQSGACCYMPSIYPNLSSMDIGTASSRWRKIYAHDMDMSGDLSLASSSHIDIGPARIEYDATTGAIHVTTNQTGNNAPAIGFYADGFNSAGGAGANDGGGGGYGVESITSNQDGTVDFHFTGGDVTTVDLNHEHPQYPKYVHLASESEMPANPDPNTMYIIDGSGGGGGGSYTLPIASASTLGGIKVGDGLSIDGNTGVLSTATKIVYLTSESQMPQSPDANTLYIILES